VDRMNPRVAEHWVFRSGRSFLWMHLRIFTADPQKDSRVAVTIDRKTQLPTAKSRFLLEIDVLIY
jgi:hypothetical protein